MYSSGVRLDETISECGKPGFVEDLQPILNGTNIEWWLTTITNTIYFNFTTYSLN